MRRNRRYVRPSSFNFEYSLSYEDEAGIVVVFDCHWSSGRPAKINADPEDCYPAEPDEYDLDNPRVDLGKGKTRKLTAEELKKIGFETEADLIEHVMETADDVHDCAETAAQKYDYPD